jgi:phosphatidylinositol-3-phosphatase
MKHHNPFAYFADVRNSSNEKFNLVPFTHFHTDLQNGQLPDFSYIVPNSIHDAHSGSLSTADAWLKQNIAPLLANSGFQQDGLLIIVFDEAADSDSTRGGGHVAMVVVGPKVRNGFRSTHVYQHQSTLRLIMSALGMSSFPGAAASAPTMSEFFVSGTSSSGVCSTTSTGVRVCSPSSGSSMGSPVKITAGAYAPVGVASMMVYVDNKARYTTYTNAVNTSLSMSAGTHSLAVKAWDHQGHLYTHSLTFKAN